MAMNSMRSIANDMAGHGKGSTVGKGSHYGDEMLEPVDNSFNKDMMGAGSKRNRSTQQRASDGKFESGFAAGRKNSQYAQFDQLGGRSDSHRETQATGGRKSAGARKRGGGGNVGRAFYDAGAASGSQQAGKEPMLSSQISAGKFSEMSDQVMMDGVDDEESKNMIIDGAPVESSLGKATLGAIADNAMSVEEGICKVCGQARPPQELMTGSAVVAD